MVTDAELTTAFLSGLFWSYHSVAAWKSGQPHPAHVKQAYLSIVVWQSNDLLVGRDADPERSDVVAL